MSTARVLVALSTACALASCEPSCFDRPRTFTIDVSRAAMILDADGHPTLEGCQAVCLTDGDASYPDGFEFPGDRADGCKLVSNGAMLQVMCFYRRCAA